MADVSEEIDDPADDQSGKASRYDEEWLKINKIINMLKSIPENRRTFVVSYIHNRMTEGP